MCWILCTVAAIIGGVIGAAIMAAFCIAGTSDQTQELIRLRVALGDLARAVGQGGADEYERAIRLAGPLEEARKVLDARSG